MIVAADVDAKGVFGYKNHASGVREDDFFREKTVFFVFFKKKEGSEG